MDREWRAVHEYFTPPSSYTSMRHRIKNDVDAQREGTLLGEGMKEIVVLAFAFPAVAVIAIVRGDDHDAAFGVQDGAYVHFFRPGIAARLPRDAILAAAWLQAADALQDIRRLKLLLRHLNVENHVKDRMVHGQFHKIALRLGKDPLHLVVKVFPLQITPKIVRHEKTAIQQVIAKNLYLLLIQSPSPRFGHVNPRIVIEVPVVEPEKPAVRIDLQRCH